MAGKVDLVGVYVYVHGQDEDLHISCDKHPEFDQVVCDDHPFWASMAEIVAAGNRHIEETGCGDG